MNILVACEESQVVTKEFRKKGHNAFSCDILYPSGERPEWHIHNDVIPLINNKDTYHIFTTCDGKVHELDNWDMLIAFPPCTDLAVSGARWFEEKRKDGRQQKSINFFTEFTKSNIDKIAIENPIGIMSNLYKKPSQIIQPWQFGHGETKATCLWLKNLPLLIPTDIVDGREQRIWKMAPGPERAKERSKTFLGIAKAMAEQWG